jgi:hypothetical protein
MDPCDYNVRLGEHHLDQSLEDHVDVVPDRIVIHPKYSNSLFLMHSHQCFFFCVAGPRYQINDVALLHLSTPAPIETHNEIGVIELAQESMLRNAIHCQVAGWGRHSKVFFSILPVYGAKLIRQTLNH